MPVLLLLISVWQIHEFVEDGPERLTVTTPFQCELWNYLLKDFVQSPTLLLLPKQNYLEVWLEPHFGIRATPSTLCIDPIAGVGRNRLAGRRDYLRLGYP